ncbi:MAG: aminoacyl-tRNA hydrolase [Desulfobacterales bacterium]
MNRKQFRLVAGLGNPDKLYSATRHNIGFMVIDALAEKYSIPVEKKKSDVLFGQGKIDGSTVLIAKPMAFMNRSGPPIRKLAEYFGISGEEIVVIHDDIDLAFERLKIKMKGGHGGHNGIRSMTGAFGNGDFARIRIGIGRPEGPREVTDYVLGKFSSEENEKLGRVISMAGEAVVTILRDGIQEGMKIFNQHN